MATNMDRKIEKFERTKRRQRQWIAETTQRAQETVDRALGELNALCSVGCDCPGQHCAIADLKGLPS